MSQQTESERGGIFKVANNPLQIVQARVTTFRFGGAAVMRLIQNAEEIIRVKTYSFVDICTQYSITEP